MQSFQVAPERRSFGDPSLYLSRVPSKKEYYGEQMDDTTRKTYGQTMFDHHSKGYEQEDDIREYTRAMQGDVLGEIWRVIEQDKNKLLYTNKDFYIVVCWQVKRIGGGFAYPTVSRLSCPTPQPAQSVFRYRRLVGDIQFMWTLPKLDKIEEYWLNKSKYLSLKDEANSCKFAVLYKTGELLKWVKKENGEKPDAIITVT